MGTIMGQDEGLVFDPIEGRQRTELALLIVDALTLMAFSDPIFLFVTVS
jgi:hypothetical protein